MPYTLLNFQAHTETLQNRVARRRVQADDASEADLAVLHTQLTTREPLTTVEWADALTIDTDHPQATQHLLDAIRAMSP